MAALRIVLAAALLLALAATPARAQDSFGQLPRDAGCVAFDDTSSEGSCVPAPGLSEPVQAVVGPGEGQVYVVSDESSNGGGTNGVAVLSRAASTGELTFASCVSDDGGD